MFKEEDMGDVEEEVLRSLGWTNFTKIQPVETGSKVQMKYEFGIFSTIGVLYLELSAQASEYSWWGGAPKLYIYNKYA
ncbi:hypothetical protein L6452_29998 [Arctium lappa]|uniref:Uncharacterized protein n=1 Tax=Arctium lappa TaxID=4217 RepID=A0ACB8ZIM9_ARCLA|nr:hypothetical protein L6452_29998 [Arctium lappa]